MHPIIFFLNIFANITNKLSLMKGYLGYAIPLKIKTIFFEAKKKINLKRKKNVKMILLKVNF